jgi:hypothetical protein
MATPVAMVVVAMVPAVHDAAMILPWLSARRIVVGEDRRGGGGQEGRADGGDQETLHSLFL